MAQPMAHHDTLVFRSDDIESIWRYARPWRMVLDLLKRRQLIWQFTVREIQGRYRGSYLGVFWALVTPLLTLAVYTFVFGVAVKGPASHNPAGIMDFALRLFSGLVAYSVFAECAAQAPSLISGNPNFVKKVVFPLEVLPVSVVGSALIHSLLSLSLILVSLLVTTHRLHWTLVMLPLAYVPLIGFSLAAGWFLSSLGVFIRDIGNIVGVAVHLLFFMTPIAYPPESLPRIIVLLNPFATIVDTFKRVVNFGQAPDWLPLGIVSAVSFVAALLGYMWFMKIKRAFADVI